MSEEPSSPDDVLDGGVTVALGSHGGTHRWDSVAKGLEWLRDESQKWSWINDPSRLGKSESNTLHSRFRKTYDKAIQILEQAEETQSNAALKQAAAHIESHLSSQQFLHSESIEGRYVLKLQRSHPVIAFGALVEFLGLSQLAVNANGAQLGAAKAAIFKATNHDHCSLWDTTLKQLYDKFGGLSAGMLDYRAQIGRQLSSAIARYRDAEEEQRKNHNTQMEAADKLFTTIEDKYAKKMALESAVKYWEDFSKDRFSSARKWFIVTAVIFLSLLGISLGRVLLSEEGSLQIFKALSDSIRIDNGRLVSLNLGVLAAITVSLAVLFWILRLTIRQMLSEMHLGKDASFRAMAAQTYLALREEGKLTTDEEFRLVLDPLFKPPTTGVIQDDAHPLQQINIPRK